jgi:hypothetical protein
MQFYSFIKNINAILSSFNKKGQAPTQTQEPVAIGLVQDSDKSIQQGQLGLFTQAVQTEINKNELEYSKKLITDSSDFDTVVDNLSSKSCILFDIEAEVQSAVASSITGISIAYCDNIKFDDTLQISKNSI